MRQSRRGFTLIEILVVIGIIMILVSLLIYGFRAMNRSAAGNETKAELKVCKGMLAEYEGRNGLQGIEFLSTTSPDQTVDSGAPQTGLQKFPVYPDPDVFPAPAPSEYTWVNGGAKKTPPTPPDPVSWPSLALSDVAVPTSPPTYNGDIGDRSTGAVRYSVNGVRKTFDVMYVLVRIPANQTHLQAIESKRQMEQVPGSSSLNTLQQGNILLDGWGNPIIFVPRGGMHVHIADAAKSSNPPHVVLVRSTGSTDLGPDTGSTPTDPPLTGNERPFFASAGQDGDFTQGEDNVYSFQD